MPRGSVRVCVLVNYFFPVGRRGEICSETCWENEIQTTPPNKTEKAKHAQRKPNTCSNQQSKHLGLWCLLCLLFGDQISLSRNISRGAPAFTRSPLLQHTRGLHVRAPRTCCRGRQKAAEIVSTFLLAVVWVFASRVVSKSFRIWFLMSGNVGPHRSWIASTTVS